MLCVPPWYDQQVKMLSLMVCWLLPRVSLNNVSLYRGFPLSQFPFPRVSRTLCSLTCGKPAEKFPCSSLMPTGHAFHPVAVCQLGEDQSIQLT